MLSKIAIIDYGMGNLYSVRNAFLALGTKPKIVTQAMSLKSYDKVVLPGVGAFNDAMVELKKRMLVGPIKDFVATGKSFLGICLGMQLLFGKSEEARGVGGLSLIEGTVKRFSRRLKCPHMGWNQIEKSRGSLEIYKGIRDPLYVYFCHSYYCKPKDKAVAIGVTKHGSRFASMVKKDNVYGAQFHPEKSQAAGLALLKNFIAL